ncbi:sigma 54-interacting transcriptional regulator [Lactobacillus sp. ESL0791]|uniref:sigma 54-interacting transcriptional regulator n=1 Tax=Lactobacillus sp. ESL0791 TaxID=2983234 RepID=UPI0023F98AFE|nr:sigma 54-interacting transcriptional regulator [Lactobacillus sp. ESL0791]MDF7639757.1 sigma 54-interacting transcriptional regulator [Lactobacillus sp. ESL0791]
MNFSRKDRINIFIEEKTKSLLENIQQTQEIGISTNYIAEKLKITRSNVSKELNILFREQKVLKISGKPVLYLSLKPLHAKIPVQKEYIFSKEQIKQMLAHPSSQTPSNDIFDSLIGSQGSLEKIVEQLKSAILYPPHGMNIILSGSTGVGKTTMVNYLYNYAVTEGTLAKNAPLISFDCADYVDNPQLLMSLLFGYEKGAFTDASSTQEGLVKKAENGILFLDEVHRLPPQAQEMLFQVMDNHVFRRLGQVETNSIGPIMFIMATTEDIKSNLLRTFIRRIPVSVTLPDVDDRFPSEKLDYIYLFLKEESHQLKQQILVDKEVISALLIHKVPNNLGQLKVEIKLACARAFMKNRRKSLQPLPLTFNDLSEQTIKAYFEEKNTSDMLVQDLISRLPKITKIDYQENDTFDINSLTDKAIKSFAEPQWFKGTNKNNGLKEAYQEASSFYHQINTFDELDHSQVITKIIDYNVYLAIKTTLTELQVSLDKNTVLGLMLHINTLRNKMFSKQVPHYSKDNSTQKKYPQEYKLAMAIRKRLNQLLDFYIPEGELIFLTMLLHMSKEDTHNSIGILALSHGINTASSMCNVVNSFLNTSHAVGIDLPLDKSTDKIFKQVLSTIDKLDQGAGVLILSDMGSLSLFANLIQEKTHHQVMNISPISTPMLLEATRKSMLPNANLQELTDSLEKDFTVEQEPQAVPSFSDRRMIESLEQFLLFLDPKKVVALLQKVLHEILAAQNDLEDSNELQIKFIFHCSSMIERVIIKDPLPYKHIKELKAADAKLFSDIRQAFKLVENTYFISIPDAELAYVVEIFDTHFSLNH